jgi:hypothetical protein
VSEDLHEWINGQSPEFRAFARLLIERITVILAKDRSSLLTEIDALRARIETLESAERMRVADR